MLFKFCFLKHFVICNNRVFIIINKHIICIFKILCIGEEYA